MKIISLFNQKGGVAKTISSVNLATCLALENYKVLLVDLDGQSNATKNFNKYEDNGLSVYNILVDKDIATVSVIKSTGIENLDILPSNINMIGVENEILLDTSRSREFRLKNSLKSIDQLYDFCIIDCPPALGIIITNALTASNDIIIPIKIDKFALDGFSNLVKAVNSVKSEFNPNLNIMGALITIDESTSVNREIKKYLKQELKDKLFKTTIRKNVDVVKSTFEYTPVVLYNRRAKASQDYVAFTKEVLNHVK